MAIILPSATLSGGLILLFKDVVNGHRFCTGGDQVLIELMIQFLTFDTCAKQNNSLTFHNK